MKKMMLMMSALKGASFEIVWFGTGKICGVSNMALLLTSRENELGAMTSMRSTRRMDEEEHCLEEHCERRVGRRAT